ncbi:transmembrane protein 232 isoform X2 [Ornithorhynchus anatinus]|uniref:transmembrane protein 232 isoform X2 n=1 Tax=Ornithorhynchus anatinus TaxID=9258 RepID=UPI0004543E24|nr:transmembrane protein 232 isoform X2 [Ornithorhynchus anatinus]
MPHSTCAKQINRLEIMQHFVLYFNKMKNPETQKYFFELATKMLCRCKKRLGLSSLGLGNHVDLPGAWAEAIVLTQCRGKIQEEALDILYLSLDHAYLNPDHIPVLFFIGESVLFGICSKEARKKYLYSGEIKLIKIGFLTFLRLFIYHLYGVLEGFNEHKLRLHSFLRGLVHQEDTYYVYPDILFTLHFMQKAGEAICNMELCSETYSSTLGLSSPNFFQHLLSDYGERIINHFLWNCTVAWACVHDNSLQLDDVLKHVISYKHYLHPKYWLDSVLSLVILGEAAKSNMSCLRILLTVMRDFISNCISLQKQATSKAKDIASSWEIVYIYTFILEDICLRASTLTLKKTALLGFWGSVYGSQKLGSRVKVAQEYRGLKGGSVLDLLQYYLSQESDDCNQLYWTIRYNLFSNLIKMFWEFSGDDIRDALHGIVWKAIQKIKESEKDSRVIEALKISEDELNEVTNPFRSSSVKVTSNPRNPISFQQMGWRFANALSKLYLPSSGPYFFRTKKVEKKQTQTRYRGPNQGKGKKATCSAKDRQGNLKEEAREDQVFKEKKLKEKYFREILYKKKRKKRNKENPNKDLKRNIRFRRVVSAIMMKCQVVHEEALFKIRSILGSQSRLHQVL